MTTVVLALYRFTALTDLPAVRDTLLSLCQEHGIKGSLLLASEGINGTVAGPRQGINALRTWLTTHYHFEPLDFKESLVETPPFYRMKVKLKKEIVTLGRPEANPTVQVGEYVDPQEWNALVSDPDVILLDTRNDYEYLVGTFENAVNPNTTHFRQFPDFVKTQLDPTKHKKVAMFCTGGIRCEKASSYMLAHGFEKVYHLKGGILNYLEKVPAEQSKWKGECFVFDHRVTVQHDLTPGHYSLCHACRHPVSEAEMQSPLYIKDVSCPHCAPSQSDRNKQRAQERAKQVALAQKRGETHIG